MKKEITKTCVFYHEKAIEEVRNKVENVININDLMDEINIKLKERGNLNE